jgi:hypothetical protein
MTRADLFQEVVAYVASNGVVGEDEGAQVQIVQLPDKMYKLDESRVRAVYSFLVKHHKPEGRVTKTFTAEEVFTK